MRKHTGVQPDSCELCIKKFVVSHALKSHMLVHTGEKPYVCVICKKAYRLKTVLTNHMRIAEVTSLGQT